MNSLSELPLEIAQLTQLRTLFLSNNSLSKLPLKIGQLTQLQSLNLRSNALSELPPEIGQLTQLHYLNLSSNALSELPPEIVQLTQLQNLYLDGNPLSPNLEAAYAEGLSTVLEYLKSNLGNTTVLNEAKLILVGEGEVGKTCLMDALEGLAWQKHESTHGIQIRTIDVQTVNGTDITLNGWDFGGQRVYRPTHQLFFSAPAVYLVVWKPREGSQQGMVKEWIRLVKHREPDAKIVVVATHGGPENRRPDIDQHEIIETFGEETILGFYHVNSKPDESSNRLGIEELKAKIAEVAAALPEMGQSVPKKWEDVRQALQAKKVAHLKLDEVYAICQQHDVETKEAKLFLKISHRLGHFIHYENDTTLRDIVVLKPDWLATAISFVLDDKQTRDENGLIRLSRLNLLWNNPDRPQEEQYPIELHPIFIGLMEKFELSYRVVGPTYPETDPTYLIAQLVSETRPQEALEAAWSPTVSTGDVQKTQICQIKDDKGASAPAEGLFYNLIVRLHRNSLGKDDYQKSVHWKRGLVIDDDFNGKAFLEHTDNDVRITVRAAYPQGLLSRLTGEVKYLIDDAWEGLKCSIMVPCVAPCGRNQPGTNLFDVEQLSSFKRKGVTSFPCMVSGCDEVQSADALLSNAPTLTAPQSLFGNAAVLEKLDKIHNLQVSNQSESMQSLGNIETEIKSLQSQVDASFRIFIQMFADEAKDGPRLFSFVPVDRSKFNPKTWTKSKFRLTLWCEHTRKPLPRLWGDDSKGVYDIELTRDWFKKAAPYLNFLTGTLKLVLPVAVAGVELNMEEDAYKDIQNQLKFSEEIIDASLDLTDKGVDALTGEDFKGKAYIDKAVSNALGEDYDAEFGESVKASGGSLRVLHSLLREEDVSFGGLVRVDNKSGGFIWVHPSYVSIYA